MIRQVQAKTEIERRIDYSVEIQMIENKQYDFTAMYEYSKVVCVNSKYLFLKIPYNRSHGLGKKAIYKLLISKNEKTFIFQGSIDSDGQLMTNKCESINQKNGKSNAGIKYKDLSNFFK